MQEFSGRDYLRIDIASSYGLDKKTWAERLHWFNENEDKLLSLVSSAAEPALFFAGVQAWQATQRGEPTGYTIGLDATSSGLQLMACLTGDRKAAELCNVVDTGKRENAYQTIYNTMVAEIGEDSKIEPDDVKSAIMTSLYGSKAMPKEIFGEGALLDLFYKTMDKMAPGAWELNEAFLTMWNPDALMNSWVLPDNFHVHVKIMNQVSEKVHFLNKPYDITYKVNAPVEEGRSLSANCIHSVDAMVVREVTRRCDYDPTTIWKLKNIISFGSFGNSTLTDGDNLVVTLWDHYKKSGYLSARILDYLTVDNLGHVEVGVITDLLDSLPKKPFKVISVHDRFGVLANYGNDLRHQYALQLQMIAKSNLLSFLISQIMERPVQIGKLDDNLYKDIINSNYALS